MAHVYEHRKDFDGFLYITYTDETTLGNDDTNNLWGVIAPICNDKMCIYTYKFWYKVLKITKTITNLINVLNFLLLSSLTSRGFSQLLCDFLRTMPWYEGSGRTSRILYRLSQKLSDSSSHLLLALFFPQQEPHQCMFQRVFLEQEAHQWSAFDRFSAFSPG